MRISFGTKLLLAVILGWSLESGANAAPRAIKFRLSEALPAGASIISIGASERLSVATISSGTFVTVRPYDPVSKIYLRSADGRIIKQVVAKSGRVRNGVWTLDSRGNRVLVEFRAGSNLGRLGADGLVAALSRNNYKRGIIPGANAEAAEFIPKGLAVYGATLRSSVSGQAVRGFASSADADGDGLVNALDIDDDGDGILDNYEASSSSSSSASTSSSDASSSSSSSQTAFVVTNTLSLSIADSINQHTTGLSTSSIDARLSSGLRLHIPLLGEDTASVELDCGALTYCSTGGTGRVGSDAFPGTLGGSHDEDSDGFGNLSGFQASTVTLEPRASSSEIRAGDLLVQRVESLPSDEALYTGIIKFVFATTPVIESLKVNGGSSQVVNYSETPRRGSPQSCFIAPRTGDVSLSLVGWRPQRGGITAAGEGDFVDIGLSDIIVSIPQGACSSPEGACAALGAGDCAASTYSTTDANLLADSTGLHDQKPDVDSTAGTSYAFNLSLSACLNDPAHAPVPWADGETLYLTVSFKSAAGDAASQTFCITRSAGSSS